MQQIGGFEISSLKSILVFGGFFPPWALLTVVRLLGVLADTDIYLENEAEESRDFIPYTWLFSFIEIQGHVSKPLQTVAVDFCVWRSTIILVLFLKSREWFLQSCLDSKFLVMWSNSRTVLKCMWLSAGEAKSLLRMMEMMQRCVSSVLNHLIMCFGSEIYFR